MRPWMASMACLLALALAAGCLDGRGADDGLALTEGCPASPLDQPGVRIALPSHDPIDDDKDNATEFQSTNVRTCSLPAIGRSALSPGGVPHKYIGEIDMRGDLGLGVVA